MEKCPKCGNFSVNELGECVVCDDASTVNPYAVSEAITTNTNAGLIVQSEQYPKLFVGDKYHVFFPHSYATPKGWNWAAFVFGVFWFIYRKMYFYAAAYLGIGFLLTTIEEILGMSDTMMNATSIALGVAAGMWANRLYKHHIDKKIAETLRLVNGSEIVPALKAKGGTNLVGALIALVMLVAVIAFTMTSL